jgi:hypothetical protein
MRRADSWQREVVEVRSRLFGERWDSVLFDVKRRMDNLNRLFNGGGDEIRRHIIVSSIAALQTFHRGTIVSIVDSDETYKTRAAQSITEKFSMQDALVWLTGKSATFGELAAHLSPCNSVTDMVSTLRTLLDVDMKKALAEAIDPYAVRNGVRDARPLVDDADVLLSDLGDAFRLRHILAHEAAANLSVSAETAERLWAAVATWIEAMNAVLWTTAYANLPLTQREMTVHAGTKLREKRAKLAKLLWLARAWARGEKRSKWLRSNQRLWAQTVKDWSTTTYGSLDGTMWPSVNAADTAIALQGRIDQLHAWLNWQNPEERDWVGDWVRAEEARVLGD